MFFDQKKLSMDKIVVHLIKYTPDKIFNFNTYFRTKYNVENVSVLYKYKSKQGLIVTLRAPKHFKVGRQQYNTYRDLVYVSISFKKGLGTNIPNAKVASAIVNTSNSLLSSIPYTFISDHSCLKFSYTVSCKFNVV